MLIGRLLAIGHKILGDARSVKPQRPGLANRGNDACVANLRDADRLVVVTDPGYRRNRVPALPPEFRQLLIVSGPILAEREIFADHDLLEVKLGHHPRKEFFRGLQGKRAVKGKNLDNNFLIIARTDARASEGLDKAIDRAKSYVDAGAEMIFPEALADEKEFEIFRQKISVPLLANMTEFGKSKLLNTTQLQNLGFNVVIYPVTLLRLAMKAAEQGLDAIFAEGSQESIVKDMQTRKELYDLTRYEDYNSFDQSLFNFKI